MLMETSAPQRKYEPRDMFNTLRWIVRAGARWRILPNDFQPWEWVHLQTQRGLKAGCFESVVSATCARSCAWRGRGRRQPSAVILDGRTLQSFCESGPRAGYDGHKRKRSTNARIAVDTLEQLLAVCVTRANEPDCA